MKKYLFTFFWLVIGVLLIALSLVSRNEQSAMMARVESRVISLSFEHAVKVKKIHVVPGQEVRKGDLLIEVESPELQLDFDQKVNEIAQLDLEIKSSQNDFERNVREMNIDYEGKFRSVQSDIQRLEIALSENQSSRDAVKKITGVASQADSSIRAELSQKKRELQLLQQEKVIRKQNLDGNLADLLDIQTAKKNIAIKELTAIEMEMMKLTAKAEGDGIVGNVFTDIHELVSSFSKVLTIYEEKPSQIKAFVNEALAETLQVGQQVMVRASNREVMVNGTIEEIGSRVTNYPAQMNPMNDRYGQEVFIRIPQTHAFLDGEQVFVFPTVSEK